MEISILIDEEYAQFLDAAWLEDISRKVLAAEGAAEDSEMSLVVTTQEEVRRLNREYRNLDEPTDVLSFHMPPGSEADGFIVPPDQQAHLGEVIISYPQALAQAQERGHPARKETAILLTHGILHLLGYDHETVEDEQKMQAREGEILADLGAL